MVQNLESMNRIQDYNIGLAMWWLILVLKICQIAKPKNVKFDKILRGTLRYSEKIIKY